MDYKTCNNCGKRVKGDSNFCPYCKSTSFTTDAVTVSPKREIARPEEKNDLKRILFYWNYDGYYVLAKSKIVAISTFLVFFLSAIMAPTFIAVFIFLAIASILIYLIGFCIHKLKGNPSPMQLENNDYGFLIDMKYLLTHWQNRITGEYVISKTKCFTLIIFFGILILPDFPMNLSSNDVKGGKSIKLGKLLYGGTTSNVEINLPLDTLSSHALVCGVTGSGKTNTVLGILEGFMLHEKPFLVIEPAKTEYVDWALKYNTTVSDDKRIIVFMPGCTNYLRAQSLKDNGGISYSAYRNGFVPNELRINPFEVISLEGSEMRTISHIDRLKSVFSSAFPMQDVLPVVMERLLYTLYTDKFQLIDKEDRNFMQNGFPTLSDVNKKFICDVIDEIGYGLENTRNISAALHTRFQTLTKGWKGKLLNNKERSLPWEELFGTQGIVINLSFVGDDQDRAFIMNLLLQFLYEYRIAEAEIGNSPENSNGCKHLIVIEEAHRIMSRCDNPEAPIYKSEQMFRDFLSESRNYGQGMMVVDQVPTRLIEDAVKNTNIKIIHKLVAADDSFTIAESVGLTHDQQKVIPKLATGQAIVSGIFGSETKARNNTNVYLAQINKNS